MEGGQRRRWAFFSNLGVLNSGLYGPPSREPGSGRARVTVLSNSNWSSRLRGSLHVRDVCSAASHRKVPSKIEIAIVKVSIPGNRDERSAHHPFDGTRIEAGCKPPQIGFKIT